MKNGTAIDMVVDMVQSDVKYIIEHPYLWDDIVTLFAICIMVGAIMFITCDRRNTKTNKRELDDKS
jgi:hypothetical protein